MSSASRDRYPLTNATIAVEDGVIAAIAPRSCPADARALDLGGRYLLPWARGSALLAAERDWLTRPVSGTELALIAPYTVAHRVSLVP